MASRFENPTLVYLDIFKTTGHFIGRLTGALFSRRPSRLFFGSLFNSIESPHRPERLGSIRGDLWVRLAADLRPGRVRRAGTQFNQVLRSVPKIVPKSDPNSLCTIIIKISEMALSQKMNSERFSERFSEHFSELD